MAWHGNGEHGMGGPVTYLVVGNGDVLSWRGALDVVSPWFDGYGALASDARCVLPTTDAHATRCWPLCFAIAISLQVLQGLFVPAGLLASELGVVLLAGRVLGQARRITRQRLGPEELMMAEMQCSSVNAVFVVVMIKKNDERAAY